MEPKTKREIMYGMVDHVGETKGSWFGKSTFEAEDVDVLEITYPHELYLQFSDKDMSIDLRKDKLNKATKRNLVLLLTSISPTRTHAYIEGNDKEIGVDEE